MGEAPTPWRGSLIWATILSVLWGGLFLHAWLDESLAENADDLVVVKGKVTKSELKTKSYGGGVEYKLDLVASYEVDGRKYKATPGIFGIVGDDELSAEGLANRYPLQQPIDVWTAPEDPSLAYLKPPEGGYGEKFRANLVLLAIGTLVIGALRVRSHRAAGRHAMTPADEPGPPPT